MSNTDPIYREPPRNLAESYTDAYTEACRHVEHLLSRGIKGAVLQNAIEMRDRFGRRLCELRSAGDSLVPVTTDGDSPPPNVAPN